VHQVGNQYIRQFMMHGQKYIKFMLNVRRFHTVDKSVHYPRHFRPSVGTCHRGSYWTDFLEI